MPESDSYWFIASPLDGDATEMAHELSNKIDNSGQDISLGSVSLPKPTGNRLAQFNKITLPEFKTGTLSSLLSLSDLLAKYDPSFTSILGKIVDTIKSLDPNNYQQHLIVEDGSPYEDYLLKDWQWNRAKYRVENRPLEDLVETFHKDMTALDNIHKQKLNNYNSAKTQLQTLQRKKTGNLQNRDLSTVINKEDIQAGVEHSEYLETLYVAVPKNNVKDWNLKYERLTSMVVPRSSTKLASDDEFVLFTVTVFRKVKDEFLQKCREEKFTVREFIYDESAILKQKQEFEDLKKSERDLWAELLRISRINFSEGFQLIVHLKIIKTFVESVLRYGLPAHYFNCIVKPEPKQIKKLLNTLNSYFEPFTPLPDTKSNSKSSNQDDMVGEYQNFMEAELFRFILFELPDIKSLDKS